MIENHPETGGFFLTVLLRKYLCFDKRGNPPYQILCSPDGVLIYSCTV